MTGARIVVSLIAGSKLLLCAAGWSIANPPDATAAAEFFEAKVRPVLSERCYSCHGPEKQKGGLRVDSLAALLKGGDNGPALVPGDVGKSRIVEAIGYQNLDLQMPPKGRLSPAEVAAITTWVKDGAVWAGGAGGASPAPGGTDAFDLAKRKAEHWAWQPVSHPNPPAVKDTAWPADAIDRFILARIEEKGLTPAPSADKRTLIRRATLDVIGLPPTVAEVDAFLADDSPDAFAKVIDRLLASPHFGERWGRHWLDLVRYAETRGHEFDHEIDGAFQYRDYVIRALNADVPYDQFVTEHVAGDLMPKPRTSREGAVNESVLGTGFWFLGEWVHSPVDIRQDECDRVDNQIDVFGKTFLGLTISCARCHDHKFDAIGTRDYYALAGYLHSSGFRDARFEHAAHNRAISRKLAELDDATREKVLAAIGAGARENRERLAAYLLVAGGRREKRDDLEASQAEAWAAELKRARKDASDPLHPLAVAMAAESAEAFAQTLTTLRDKLAAPPPADAPARMIADYRSADRTPWITADFAFGSGPVAAGAALLSDKADAPIREVLTTGAAIADPAGGKLPGMLRTPTFLIEPSATRLSFLVRGVGHALVCIDSHRMIKGPLHGVCNQGIKTGDAWKVVTVNLSGYIGERAHVEFSTTDGPLAVQWVQLGAERSTTSNPALNPLVAALVAGRIESRAQLAERTAGLLLDAHEALLANRTGDQPGRAAVAAWVAGRLPLFGYDDAARSRVADVLGDHQTQRGALLSQVKASATAPTMFDGTAFDERVLIRGNPRTPGEAVPRRFLAAITDASAAAKNPGSGRLELARQMVDPANPLTARVYANRIWHHLFGRGIVASTDNFGVLGDRPTHPELLDHLAMRFVGEGWSTKRMIRAIMLSRTYQVASVAQSERARTVDPMNLLLAHQNIRRLEAEAIRDSILAISGRLDPALHGPSVEVHLTPFMDGRGKPGGDGPLDGNGRRSIYTKVRRNFLPPMMLAFDMPQPFNSMGRRSVSNVPAQALILMNDPFVVQQAERWAKRVLAEKDLTGPSHRIVRMYEMAYARPPTPDEQAAAMAFLQQQGETHGVATEKRRDDPRVWADLAHVLMNVKEFIYVN